MIYLRKANADLVSFCRCPRAAALIDAPMQLDCPWCGCGWLFACGTCRKAFAFAEAVEVAVDWPELATRSYCNRFWRDPLPEEIERWACRTSNLLSEIRLGEQYVYWDGRIVPTSALEVRFVGAFAQHDLDFVPQVAAIADRTVRPTILEACDYWIANRRPE